MDMVIAQLERPYMESLIRYNKALSQRNALLKQEDGEPDGEVMDILEEQMAMEGEFIYERRRLFVDKLVPLFQSFYQRISGGQEQVSLSYRSHCQRGPLLDVIRRDRMKDLAVGYSLHGVHRDDLDMLLDGHPMRREGSQGQQKTFVVSLKMAQFCFLQRAAGSLGRKPLLLLDDIFDKLDARRVEQIVSLVSGQEFGQIFITDTNREHLDQILAASSHHYKLFLVHDGEVTEKTESLSKEENHV
jgi:DNA replication and repair protein RecF